MKKKRIYKQAWREKDKIRARKYYRDNRDKVLAKEKIRQSTDAYKLSRRDYDRKRRSEKGDHIRELFNIWYEKNRGYMIDKAKKWKHENPLKAQFNRYTERAKRDGLIFEFTREEFTALIQENCAYCGFENPLGADRIDNTIGYTKENTAPCCKFCNLMKLNHTLVDFLIHIKSIIDYLEL